MPASSKPQVFNMRGENMDRVETFVAAAFAFAVTMLIISVDDVPTNFEAFIHAVKLIPSFGASFAIILWIWATHANWCRRYGLEDGPTIVMSGILVFLVLIYIFPLRLIMQGFFAVLTDGFLPSEMDYQTHSDIRFMFGFYSVGFMALAINFFSLFQYALLKRDELELNEVEHYITSTDRFAWLIIIFVSALSLGLAIVLPQSYLGWTGYIYFLLFPFLGALNWYRDKHQP